MELSSPPLPAAAGDPERHLDVSEHHRRGARLIPRVSSRIKATEARMLLMACLLRFGALPPAADPSRPTSTEVAAVEAALRPYQEVFDTHRTRSAGASSGTSAEPLGLCAPSVGCRCPAVHGWPARKTYLQVRMWLGNIKSIRGNPIAWERHHLPCRIAGTLDRSRRRQQAALSTCASRPGSAAIWSPDQ